MMAVAPADGITEEDCGTWTQVGARSATVSTTRLQVPGKARGIYQRACGEFKKKKFADAVHDAQKAVEEHHDFPAAWVLLGQAYYSSDDIDHAHQACSKATDIDADYVPSYLCLAAIADRQKDWDLLDGLSDQALQLDPLRDAYGHYYKAEAAFHQGDMAVAEKNALVAAGDDVTHQMPEIELLLARIYSAANKVELATARVRNFLKFAHEPADAAAVNARLAAISAQAQ